MFAPESYTNESDRRKLMSFRMEKIRKFLLTYLPFHKFRHNASYAQEGEDLVLLSFYEGKKGYKGFYVDVGAHHPYRFSNTMAFYKKGWKGINIEPNPGAMKWFSIFRRRDINLNLGVAETEGTLAYYRFNESALNGFSREISEARDRGTPYRITKTEDVPVRRLDAILDEHVETGQTIDFFSIDAEGFDLEVLRSNDWSRYRPLYVLVEDVFRTDGTSGTPITGFLEGKGYRMVAKTKRTLFFKSA